MPVFHAGSLNACSTVISRGKINCMDREGIFGTSGDVPTNISCACLPGLGHSEWSRNERNPKTCTEIDADPTIGLGRRLAAVVCRCKRIKLAKLGSGLGHWPKGPLPTDALETIGHRPTAHGCGRRNNRVAHLNRVASLQGLAGDAAPFEGFGFPKFRQRQSQHFRQEVP